MRYTAVVPPAILLSFKAGVYQPVISSVSRPEEFPIVRDTTRKEVNQMGQRPKGEISWWFHLLNQPLLRRTMLLRIFLIREDARFHRPISYLCLRSSGVANTTEPRCLILRADTRIRIIRKTQYHRHFSSSCIRVTQRSFNPWRVEKAANISHCRILVRARPKLIKR